jgi:hypothetical protein
LGKEWVSNGRIGRWENAEMMHMSKESCKKKGKEDLKVKTIRIRMNGRWYGMELRGVSIEGGDYLMVILQPE